ncbi:MAG: hypothetical protein ACR2KJ_11215 [Jatrophihabitans sp.]
MTTKPRQTPKQRAVNAYLAALSQILGGATDVGLADLEENLTRAAAGSPLVEAEVAECIRTGRKQLANVTAMRANERDRIATAAAGAAITTLTAELHCALVEFEGQSDLDLAASAAVKADATYDSVLAQLEKAVERADIDKVMRLRGEVEVTLPQKVAEARLRHLELQVGRAEAQRDSLEPRTEQAIRAQRVALKAIEAAKQALDQAVERHTQQRVEVAQADDQVRRANAVLADREQQLEEMRATHKAESSKRLRRLAGLAELSAESTPDEPHTSSIMQRELEFQGRVRGPR